MKERKIYLRRSGKSFIVEGKRNNKTIFLFTLPSIEKIIMSSIFTEEKRAKIMEKIKSLDCRKPKVKKSDSEVRTIKIVGNQEKDDLEEEDEEEY